MLRSVRPSCTAVAVLAFASLAAVTSVDARGEEPRAVHHAPERTRHAVRHEAEARQSHHAYAARAEAVHAAPGRVASQHSQSGSSGGAPIPVARYSSTTRTLERTIRPGLVSRTFVSRGQVIATRTYQSHVWHQFGRAFAYETFVPTMRYPAVYYSWALAAWPRPVSYAWGWQAQPWYPTYGVLFTPYPVYTSPDLWMTDYVIAQSLQTAYQAQPASPVVQQPPQPPPEPVINSVGAVPSSPPSEVAPAPESSAPSPPPPASEGATVAPSSDTPAAPVALPPAVTPAVKAQLDTQIKVQLQDRQAQATSATLTTQSTPPALRPNHVFFQVVQPLSVPTSSANGVCSLSPSDYIKRTGGMSPDDWTIPVVVELSSPSDCPAGLHTRIGLNDLNAMENEQEARVMDALQAASKSMGPNGPPSTPEVHPTQIADSRAAPDVSGLSALAQAR